MGLVDAMKSVFVGCPEENSGDSESGEAAPAAEGPAERTPSVKAEVRAQETATTEADAKPKTDLLNQQTGLTHPESHARVFP